MTDESINCSLIIAAHLGDLAQVKLALEQGADIHAKDDSALRYAADSGHLEVVKFLFEKGADIHAVDDYALRFAFYNGCLAVVDFLIEKGDWLQKDVGGVMRLERLKRRYPEFEEVMLKTEVFLKEKAEKQKEDELKRHAERIAALQAGAKPFKIKRNL